MDGVGKAWTKEANLPTDAELIMNLFCAMLDDVLPAVSDNDRPFRRAHYAPVPPTKSASIRGMFLIYYSQPSPPNFKVIANGQVREILPVCPFIQYHVVYPNVSIVD